MFLTFRLRSFFFLCSALLAAGAVGGVREFSKLPTIINAVPAQLWTCFIAGVAVGIVCACGVAYLRRCIHAAQVPNKPQLVPQADAVIVRAGRAQRGRPTPVLPAPVVPSDNWIQHVHEMQELRRGF